MKGSAQRKQTPRTVVSASYLPPSRYRGTFDPRAAGLVVYAYVPFRRGYSGKVRPVVVVSIGDGCFYARPLYSRPSCYAGGFLATPLDLRDTTLDRAGYLSPETICVRADLHHYRVVGRLTTREWAYLRTGNAVWHS